MLFVAVFYLAITAQTPRLVVPDAVAVEAAKVKIREVLASEYKEAKTNEAKSRLAERMLARGNDVKESPENRFAFFVEAREIYIDVTDWLAAFRAIDAMCLVFDQPPFGQKIDLVQRISKVAKNSAQYRALAMVSLKLATDAAAAEDYAVAKECCQTAVTSSKQSGDAALQSRAIEQLRQQEAFFEEWQAAREALQKIKDQPNDSEANERVGRYRCLVRRDWSNGLSALMKGTDQNLATIATRDLTNPTGREDQLGLGELWLKHAESQKSPIERMAAADRAASWFEKAIPQADGIAKVAIEKRLNAANELACPRQFSKLLSRTANGIETGPAVDCRTTIQPLKLKGGFDLRKSWLLSLEFQPPNLDGGSHQIFFWGDGRAGQDPLFLRTVGDELLGACTDCTSQRCQWVATRLQPNAVGQWVNVKLVHDVVSGELELYVNYRLVGRETMTMVPMADQKMPLALGGTDATGQRFHGQVRNVWLGNIP
eukprot:TRINITY_DN224_c0_g1_i4.p1 TRINITY_DN224_c0_g1~~TRINITY_DN224_c0_g1_i4.p1  ORF type:complete len:486 (+),score=115.76 TRINITY_DN224_c0_g1_i4:341-1798(+)